ncbi:MAG TPA: hypothetical protein VKP66_18165, partial [Steroidobacteraceae bacterium]|nr:hypothetical protein [Steroidobacteraceae bacterium]
MELTQSLEGPQAQTLRLHLVLDLDAQPPLLAARSAECPHQTHVAYDVGEIATHMGGMAGETPVQFR